MQKNIFRTFEFAEEGIISTELLAEGRFIPAVVIDFEEFPDIKELLLLHKTNGGDAISQWFRSFKSSDVYMLSLKFSKPMQVDFALKFSIEKHHSLIDGVFQSQGIYITNGKKGLKVSKVKPQDWIFVEVPTTNAKPKWEKVYNKKILKMYRKHGCSKNEAKEITKEFISQSREMWKYRKNK